MATITYVAFDDDEAGHGAFYRGLRDFLRQFIIVAFTPTDRA